MRFVHSLSAASNYSMMSRKVTIYNDAIFTHQGNYLCWLRAELMRQFLVVRYQVRNVHIAVVFFDQNILPYLVTIYESVEAVPPSVVALTDIRRCCQGGIPG